MNKILRNTILSLCLTSCLAMGMDLQTVVGDADGELPKTSRVVMTSGAAAGIQVTKVGAWRLLGYKDEFVDPSTGAKRLANFDEASAALGAAWGVTQATRVELVKREEDLRKAALHSSAQDREISDLKAFLAAANASKDEQAKGLQDLATRLTRTERALEEQRRATTDAQGMSSDFQRELALLAQKTEGLQTQLEETSSAAEARFVELRQFRDTLTQTLGELAGARSAAEVNQRLADMLREDAGVKERKIGSLIERVIRFQQQLRAVVTSADPVHDLDLARKFVVSEYDKEKESLERDLDAQQGALAQARSDRAGFEKQRGQDAPSNLEELIAQAAKRIDRLQIDVEAKKRQLATLTTEKTELEKEIEALETKSVGDFIKALTGGKLRGEPRNQFSELARRGHNHKWAHGAGLSKGSQWLGEELMSKMTRDTALQLLTDGGISRAMAEWFISSGARQTIIDHGKGTTVGTEAMDDANWDTLKARFGVV